MVQARMPDITQDADDRSPLGILVAKANSLSQRVIVGKIALHERSVGDHDVRLWCEISFVENASLAQRHSQCREIRLAYVFHGNQRPSARGRIGSPFYRERSTLSIVRQWQRT